MYEIYGLKLGDRQMDSSFMTYRTDPGKIIKTAYYMWCIKGHDDPILVDTGMTDDDVKKRSLTSVKAPQDLLAVIGVNVADVKTIIATHLHSDHFSAHSLYPNATFYLQKKELEFFATADAKNAAIFRPLTDIAEVVRLRHAGRVRLLDGDEEIAPGLNVFLVGGHTPGTQVVTVDTSRGRVVLCGDAVALYRNLEDNVHGPDLDVVQTYVAYGKIRSLAVSPHLIIPDHEPLVMERFPTVAEAIIKIS